MSMTESEALEWFKGFYNGDCERENFEDTICADCNFPCKHGVPILRAISALEEIQQYRAIGTVDRFRELEERATAKSMKMMSGVYGCCSCGLAYAVRGNGYCINCGQHLYESEKEKEDADED